MKTNNLILGIVGSRSFDDLEFMESKIKDSIGIDNIDMIVSGGAKGADRVAEQLASKYNIATVIYYADWEHLGKRAGYVRNVRIVEACDMVCAFWNGESPGTKITITECERHSKPCLVFKFEE